MAVLRRVRPTGAAVEAALGRPPSRGLLSRALVGAILLLVVLAAADALRTVADEDEAPASAVPEGRITRWRIDRGPTPCRSLVPGACGTYLVSNGGITRDGESYLPPRALMTAFPDSPVGRVDAFRVADAQDGTIAVAVLDGSGRGAVEIWQQRQLVDSFLVPPTSFAAGLGWSPRGDLVATYPRRGGPTLYDRHGTRVAKARWERRPG